MVYNIYTAWEWKINPLPKYISNKVIYNKEKTYERCK